jgi:hypothetical protein
MFPVLFAFVNKYIYFCTENSQVFNFRYSIPNNPKPASLLHAPLLLNLKCQVTFVPTVHLSCIRPVSAVISVHNCSILSSYIFLLLPIYNNSSLCLRFVCSTNYLTYLRQITPFFFFQPLQIYLPVYYDQLPSPMCSPSCNILFDNH